MVDLSDHRDPVEALSEEFLNALREGKRVSVEQYAARYPEWGNRIRELFPTLLMLEGLKADERVSESSDRWLVCENGSPALTIAHKCHLTSIEHEGHDLLSANRPVAFDRYKILELLGEGGMGSVYLAHDTHLDRKVAIKIPKLDQRPDTEKRFEREARAMANLHHPNICPVYDFGVIDGTCYITMAYIEGETLADHLQDRSPLASRKIAIWTLKLARALNAAHRQGVVHRDLKPANIIIDCAGEPVIMDFGLAMFANRDPGLTKDGLILGTPAYMSPEQVDGSLACVGPKSDIYSLGVLMYEMLTGSLPFDGHVVAVLHQIMHTLPTSPSSVNAESDPRLEAICLKAMAKSQEHRFESADLVAENLHKYLSEHSKRANVGSKTCIPNETPGTSTAAYAIQPSNNSIQTVQQLKARTTDSSASCKPVFASFYSQVGCATRFDDEIPKWLLRLMLLPMIVFLFLIVLVVANRRNEPSLPPIPSAQFEVKNPLHTQTGQKEGQSSQHNEPFQSEVTARTNKETLALRHMGDEKERLGIHTTASKSLTRDPETHTAPSHKVPTLAEIGTTSIVRDKRHNKPVETSVARWVPSPVKVVSTESAKAASESKGAHGKKRKVRRKPNKPKPPKPAPPWFVHTVNDPRQHHHPPSQKSSHKTFRSLDRNNDRVLTTDEVPVEHHRSVAQLDTNSDGRLTEREFSAFFKSFHSGPPPRRHHR